MELSSYSWCFIIYFKFDLSDEDLSLSPFFYHSLINAISQKQKIFMNLVILDSDQTPKMANNFHYTDEFHKSNKNPQYHPVLIKIDAELGPAQPYYKPVWQLRQFLGGVTSLYGKLTNQKVMTHKLTNEEMEEYFHRQLNSGAHRAMKFWRIHINDISCSTEGFVLMLKISICC